MHCQDALPVVADFGVKQSPAILKELAVSLRSSMLCHLNLTIDLDKDF